MTKSYNKTGGKWQTNKKGAGGSNSNQSYQNNKKKASPADKERNELENAVKALNPLNLAHSQTTNPYQLREGWVNEFTFAMEYKQKHIQYNDLQTQRQKITRELMKWVTWSQNVNQEQIQKTNSNGQINAAQSIQNMNNQVELEELAEHLEYRIPKLQAQTQHHPILENPHCWQRAQLLDCNLPWRQLMDQLKFARELIEEGGQGQGYAADESIKQPLGLDSYLVQNQWQQQSQSPTWQTQSQSQSQFQSLLSPLQSKKQQCESLQETWAGKLRKKTLFRVPYERRANQAKSSVHWGQRKLFIAELEFLMKHCSGGGGGVSCDYSKFIQICEKENCLVPLIETEEEKEIDQDLWEKETECKPDETHEPAAKRVKIDPDLLNLDTSNKIHNYKSEVQQQRLQLLNQLREQINTNIKQSEKTGQNVPDSLMQKYAELVEQVTGAENNNQDKFNNNKDNMEDVDSTDTSVTKTKTDTAACLKNTDNQTAINNSRKTVLYVGAAPGEHIELLSMLFPTQFQFILYDPRPFADNLVSYAKLYPERLQLHQKPFVTGEDIDAESAKLKINQNQELVQVEVDYLISDIRSADPREFHTRQNESQNQNNNNSNKQQFQTEQLPFQQLNKNQQIKSDEEVDGFDQYLLQDMDSQSEWVQILEPEKAMLKFRLPYTKGEVSYLDGEIVLPVWGPQTTTECRLLVSRDFERSRSAGVAEGIGQKENVENVGQVIGDTTQLDPANNSPDPQSSESEINGASSSISSSGISSKQKDENSTSSKCENENEQGQGQQVQVQVQKKNYYKHRKYNNEDYGERMFFFNTIQRPSMYNYNGASFGNYCLKCIDVKYQKSPHKYNNKHRHLQLLQCGYDSCYDCSAELGILGQFVQNLISNNSKKNTITQQKQKYDLLLSLSHLVSRFCGRSNGRNLLSTLPPPEERSQYSTSGKQSRV